MNIDEFFTAAAAQQVELVDLRYTLFPGVRRHRTVVLGELKQDGGPGRAADASTLLRDGRRLLSPVPDTAFLDPFCQHPTFAVTCDVNDTLTGRPDPDDLRAVTRRAQSHLQSTGVADRADFAPRVEFFVFDQALYDQSINTARYFVDSREGAWRRGRDDPDNLGLQPRPGAAAGLLPPADSLHNLRGEMLAALTACGVRVGGHERAPAGGGQTAIELRPAPLLTAADALTTTKYIVRSVAARHGKVVTFMPKPLFGDDGSGMSTRLALWRDDRPLFPGRSPTGLSDVGRWAMGGLLSHMPSLLAFVGPTTNSYKRLVPDFGAPTRCAWSHDDMTAAVRAPLIDPNCAADWLDVRTPDPSCDAYLAYSAILMAALDGIAHHRDPGAAIDVPTQASTPVSRPILPGSLDEALKALETDHAYLLAGGVFTTDLIQRWVTHKWENEVRPVQRRPHPYEFCLYFDV
ncbi:MAG: hypothetical protein AB1601_15435 [Planctomycetota bacterium]